MRVPHRRRPRQPSLPSKRRVRLRKNTQPPYEVPTAATASRLWADGSMGGGAARRGRSRTVEREVELAGHARVLAEDVEQQFVAIELFRARRHAVLDRGALLADLATSM